MDQKGAQILSHLRNDARKNLSTIGRELNIPVSTIHDKVRRFESGVVKRFTAILDLDKLGLNNVYLAMSCSSHHKENLRNFLNNHPQVNTLHSLTRGYDFLAEFVFGHVRELDNFVVSLKQFNLGNIEEFMTQEEIKKESYVPKSKIVSSSSTEIVRSFE
ncbi:Lrp/AsnC family transcriptional regulator [Candidatus Woesearchaeota archaeon]|jgi:DNA-binding Lrp family transcriptional regulator|nr:Lrp/AsnC family transcriptional regulator [Candidatus Woesearchaeota archaeon]